MADGGWIGRDVGTFGVAFVGGLTGQMYQQFALTIAISVLLSAFSALSLSPALSIMLLKPARPARGPLGVFFRGFNKVFERSTNGYIGVARLLVRRAILTILLGTFYTFKLTDWILKRGWYKP